MTMQVPPMRVLIVDDDAELLSALGDLLRHEGYEVALATSAEEGLEHCRRASFDVVLTDLQLPERNGLSLIRTLGELCPDTKTVLITGHGSIRSAVTALKRGAAEYLTKPIRPRRLLTLLSTFAANRPSFLTNRLLASHHAEVARCAGLVTRSPLMREVFLRIERAAGSLATVLLVGEPGSGKERIARAIHQRSSCAAGPFVSVPIGASPTGDLALELFGRPGQPGSVEQAAQGTLFVSGLELADSALVTALTALADHGVYRPIGAEREQASTARLVFAVDAPLGQEGSPLERLLGALTIQVPPLRERREDVPVLAVELVAELAEKHGRAPLPLAPETQRLLGDYAWPGNVRELKSVLEQALLLARADQLDPLLLPQLLHGGSGRNEVITIQIGTAMDDVEREVILRTLAAHDGNKTQTAEVLGISRRSIYNKLAVYGVDPDGPPDGVAPTSPGSSADASPDAPSASSAGPPEGSPKGADEGAGPKKPLASAASSRRAPLAKVS
jgi:DNA-binding NtrC family response regulator